MLAHYKQSCWLSNPKNRQKTQKGRSRLLIVVTTVVVRILHYTTTTMLTRRSQKAIQAPPTFSIPAPPWGLLAVGVALVVIVTPVELPDEVISAALALALFEPLELPP
jgi:hypothetical protein